MSKSGERQAVSINMLSVESLRVVLAHVPVGVLMVERGTERIYFANAELERMFGYAAGELAGAPLAQLLPPSVVPNHGSWVEQYFSQATRRRMGEGRSLRGLHRSGQQVPIEVGLMVHSIEGRDYGLAYILDVSEATRFQAMTAGISSALPLGLLIAEPSGVIHQANFALERMFGYGPGELVGMHVSELLPERLRADHQQHIEQYAAHPSLRAMGSGRDLMARHQGGLEFPVEVALNTFEVRGGRRVIAVISDISHRKAAEDALRQTNEQLEEFTYVASHDLRSPLRGISELLSWIREDLPAAALTPDIENNFERIQVRISRGERMIEDLLGYARAGQREERNVRIDPAKVVADAVLAAEVPDSFAVEVDVVSEPFEAAQVPLGVVLRNLIGNAVKHNPAGTGHIRVSTRDQGRYAVFTVEDDGPGVPENARARVFKLFHRANAQAEGHGVGLAVTRRMVNAHGGFVVVDTSERLGGARFSVHWPRIGLRGASDE